MTVPSRERLLGYRVESPLGAGGMASTFRAIRTGPRGVEQPVCLKCILPSFERDPEFVALFLREAQISARLQHRNIVRVLDVGEVDGAHFMALELIEGMDLAKLLRALQAQGQSFPSGLVSFLAFELGAALDYAHRSSDVAGALGVVHRDVSPSNVLLSGAGEVKLADFGIAKASFDTYVSRAGIVKGKLPYMAPEYAIHGRFDARSDLFSLGVTLYECVTRSRPFQGKTDVDTLEKLDRGIFDRLTVRSPQLPPELTYAIDRCLERRPENRFPSADAFLGALQTVAPPPTAARILAALVRSAAPIDPMAPRTVVDPPRVPTVRLAAQVADEEARTFDFPKDQAIPAVRHDLRATPGRAHARPQRNVREMARPVHRQAEVAKHAPARAASRSASELAPVYRSIVPTSRKHRRRAPHPDTSPVGLRWLALLALLTAIALLLGRWLAH